MNEQRLSADRRHEQRYSFSCSSFVSFRNPSSQLCRIIDISRSGVSFLYYKNGKEDIHSFSELDIFIRDDFHYLENIPFKIVGNSEIEHDIYGYLPSKKRICVQFNGIRPDRLSRLDHIIQEHTNGHLNDRRIGIDRRTGTDRRKLSETEYSGPEKRTKKRNDSDRRTGQERRLSMQ